MQTINRWLAYALFVIASVATANAAPPMLPPIYLDNTHPNLPAFTPEEMWNIDSKIDDGKPGMGQLVIYGADSSTSITTCTDGADATEASAATAKYLLSEHTKTCAAVFRNQF